MRWSQAIVGRRAGCGGARRTSPRCCCWPCFCASSCRSSARYVFNYPLGWTDEVSVAVLDLVHVVGRGVRACAKGTKSASTSSTARQRADAPRLHDHHRHRGHRAVRHRAARGDQLRDVPEGRDDRPISASASIISIRSTSCSRSPSIVRYARVDVARHSRASRRRSRSAAGRRCDQPVRTLHLRDPRARPARLADRLFDDRGLDPLSPARRPRPRHLRRADPQRPLQQLRAARGAAVPVLGRADERQQDDRPSAALLRHAGRPLPRRARPHQHRAEHHLRRHVRLGDRRSRRHRAHQHRHDDAQQPLSGELCGRHHRGVGGDRADHPAVDSDGALRADLGYVGRLPVPRRRHSGPADGARADGHQHHTGAPARLPGREADPAARMADDHLDRDAGAADAGHPARRNLRRRHDADRSRRGRRRLRVPGRGAVVSQHHGARHLSGGAQQLALDRLDRHADRRRADLQLRGHDRADSRRPCRACSPATSFRR